MYSYLSLCHPVKGGHTQSILTQLKPNLLNVWQPNQLTIRLLFSPQCSLYSLFA